MVVAVRRWWSYLLFWRPPFLDGVVIVNLKSDPHTALRGVVWSSRGRWFVLRNAALVEFGSPDKPIDGEVIVHRENIAFLQLLGG